MAAQGVPASVANKNGERRTRGEMGKAREQPVRVEEAWRSELSVVHWLRPAAAFVGP